MLIGNLGADPELKFTNSGQAVLKLRLATTESYQDKEGRKERTDWHQVVVWGKRAEALNKILHKGHGIWVEGRIQTHSWEAEDGSKRYATEINAIEIGIIAHGKDNQRDSRRDQEEPPEGFGSDNDIPF